MKNGITIILILLIISCNDRNKNISGENGKRIDTTHFKYNGFNVGTKLDLLNNGNFYYENYWYGCNGGGENMKVYGIYKIEDQKLILKPDSINLSTTPFTRHNNPITQTFKYGVDSLKIKTDYQIIKWDNNSYLLSAEKDDEIFIDLEPENDFQRFAYFYNAGMEPKQHGVYLVHTKNTQSDSLNTTLNLKEIPVEWRNLFLEKPISAKILKIEKKIEILDENELVKYLIEIDKGSKDNVRIGLDFIDENYSEYIKIIKVNDNKSVGVISYYDFQKRYKVGEIIKTNW